MPFDCGLPAHAAERQAARQHLAILAPRAVVVQHRGYDPLALLQAQLEPGRPAGLRLQRNANQVFRAGRESDRSAAVVTLTPPAGQVLRVRLVCYTTATSVCLLAPKR